LARDLEARLKLRANLRQNLRNNSRDVERRLCCKEIEVTEEQIAFALKQADVGTPVAEVCRKMCTSDVTFYKRRKKYVGLGPSELRRLKQLEEENSKLKRLVADLSPDKAMLQDVLAK